MTDDTASGHGATGWYTVPQEPPPVAGTAPDDLDNWTPIHPARAARTVWTHPTRSSEPARASRTDESSASPVILTRPKRAARPRSSTAAPVAPPPTGWRPRGAARAADDLDNWSPITLDDWTPIAPIATAWVPAPDAPPRPNFGQRRAAAVLICVLALLVLFQMAWPAGRFLPGERIDGIDVSGMTTAAAAQAGRYGFWQRLLPGTSFWRMGSDTGAPVHPTLTAADLPNLSRPAVDAAVAVSGSTLTVSPASTGFEANDPDLLATVDALTLSPGHAATVTVQGTVAQPSITTQAATTLRDTIMNNLGSGLAFTMAGQTTTVDVATVLSTLSFSTDGGSLAVAVSPSGLQAALGSWAASTQSPPDATQDGMSVDWTTTAASATTALTGSGGPVAVSLQVSSSADPSANYADTFDGLKQELADRFGSRPYAVSVIDLTGQGRNFSVNGDQVFTSASTYKIFVAYAMIQAVEQGSLTWNSPLNGTTLQTCFQRMIVNSDNDCPQAWLDKYGYGTLTDQAHSIGATNTNFAVSDMQTTANDLAQTLAKLYNGQLMDATDQSTMIAAMENQDYRSGIPAGLAGEATVADKVGFLDALLNDAAIVYSPKGDFVLVVMTDDSTWGDIAATASAVYDRM